MEGQETVRAQFLFFHILPILTHFHLSLFLASTTSFYSLIHYYYTNLG